VEDDVRGDERVHAQADEGGEAAYRGFLFADLRGYTAFVERTGDAAAADLLDAYRELVRAEVARHAGAEIRTEGDSFYVVFGSARRAVACALAIVEAAEQARREHPDRPIKVGIGINAGETVQRGEGFVGTAVNLAARVCAQAREGEVLVTAAVRDAIGVTPDLQSVPRGSPRLKGITRPVALNGGPAHGPWELSDIGGWFLCREVFGDAVIEWSYHDRALCGRATRRDGDLQSLLRWWTAEVQRGIAAQIGKHESARDASARLV
jgi:class 3 adenylate cyclase